MSRSDYDFPLLIHFQASRVEAESASYLSFPIIHIRLDL